MEAAGSGAGDRQFFACTGPHSLEAVAAAARGELKQSLLRGDEPLHGVSPLQAAGPSHVSFLDNRRYAGVLATTRAGAVIVHPEFLDRVPTGSAAIVTTEPYAAWARVAALFHPAPAVHPGIHPSAVIDPAATIDPSAEIGPLVVVGARVTIGPGVRIGPGAVIGDGVTIGADCRIGASVTLSHAILGVRVQLFPGARVGQDGFGFAQTEQGFLTVPQLGRVLIGDDVQVGANTTIDRGSAQDTVIGAGTRIDNLVQIAHNVHLGRCCVIVAMVGISGSVTFEDYVTAAGQAAFAGHVRVGRKARIGAQAGVISDVPAGADFLGSPAEPVRDFFRGVATLRKLARRPKGGVVSTD